MLAMGSPVQQWSVNERKIKREGRVKASFFFFFLKHLSILFNCITQNQPDVIIDH